MPEAGEDHSHALPVAEVDGILVFDRAARLNDRANTLRVGNFHTIREREECIGSHDSPLQG